MTYALVIGGEVLPTLTEPAMFAVTIKDTDAHSTRWFTDKAEAVSHAAAMSAIFASVTMQTDAEFFAQFN